MGAESALVIPREESDEEDAAVTLAAIPAIDDPAPSDRMRRPKRARSNTDVDVDADADADASAGVGPGHVVSDHDNQFEVISDDDDAREDDDGLFVQSPTSESPGPPPAKRQRPAPATSEGDDDDKKKLAMDISYEGFSIYGRVLCLVVKRRDGNGAELAERGANASAAAVSGSGNSRAKAGSRGQAMMENFILSTQIPAGTDVP